MFLFASPVFSATLSDLQVRELEKFPMARLVDFNDSHLMNIHYVGTSTEAAIGVTSITITAATPFGTADTTFGTSGTYDLEATAYDTIGELCDAIEALADYECTITDGKRNDDPALLADITAAAGSYDANAVGGYNLLIDSGTYLSSASLLLRVGITPMSGRRVILKGCVANSKGTGPVVVYGKLRKFEGVSDGVTRNDTTAVWTSAASVADTSTVYPYNSASFPVLQWMEFGIDEHVVISDNGDAGVNVTATNFLQCFWDER